MKLRTRLDMFSTALLSALGASSVVACGGSFTSDSGGGPRGGSSNSAGTGNNAGAGNDAGTGNNPGAAGSLAIGGASSGGTSSAGASNGGAANHFPCKNPQDAPSGLVQCDGFVHRAESTTCTSSLPRPEPFPSTSPAAECKMDSDCTDKPHGWCGQVGGPLPGPVCNYGCVTDGECTEGQLCMCGDPVGRCAPTTACINDGGCLPGFLCRSYDSTGGCGFTAFACQSAGDECGSDSDCATKAQGSLCRYDDGLQHFVCKPGGCAIGRPFLVEGEQRMAQASTRADWRELALLPRLAELDASLRAHLATQWTRIALMEHASIAAFARFSLQLLSLGAPAELIERTTAAMVDETKHAKACFAVASAYAGAPVGPGRLAVESSLDEMSLEQIVRNTIREGCVGETLAAIEAREAAEHCADPALRALLQVISEDETRHAELAFCFVKWALTQGDETLERAVRAEFAAIAAQAPEFGELDVRQTESLALGIVPQPMRAAIRARAVREVILPCSSALYAPKVSRKVEAALDTSAP